MAWESEIITGKNFDSPDEPRRHFEKGRIDVVTVRGLTFYRETLEPGWQWSKHVKPVVGGESCQRFHVKIFLAGVNEYGWMTARRWHLVRGTWRSCTLDMMPGLSVTNRMY
jgi:hypothetical protein